MTRKEHTQYVKWALILVTVFVIESKFRIAGIKPNILAILAYYAGLKHGPFRGLLYGTGLGILADSVSAGMLGPRMLSLGTIAYLSTPLRGGFFNWTPLLGFLALGAMTIAEGFIAYSSVVIFGNETMTLGQVFPVMFWQGAMNSLAGFCIRPGDED